MLIEFVDTSEEEAHLAFQDWRLENPNGFFITLKKKNGYVFHHVGCHHIGNPFWDGSVTKTRGTKQSITSNKKICSDDPNELLDWLSEFKFLHTFCTHCIDADAQLADLRPSANAIHRMEGWLRELAHWTQGLDNETEAPLKKEVADENEKDAQNFYSAVSRALLDSQSMRRARLIDAEKLPERFVTQSTAFRRNPDVVAEVLSRAAGKCESCLQNAPFVRASDGTPYLEVHHKITLAAGGEDTVANAIALCPNCHRAAHYA